ncbi:MOSC domain-containing protein [Actinopolymorpha alba]|uniref:MOSC domain-containing protein n=1 Tax=Actinopolymorpha alba TaxID=533267 RepID=UPI000375E4B2|nr:MOSC domain-containing protein [Actinopolymorpha alba]
MAHIQSVNVGKARPNPHKNVGQTGIDKRPVAEAVEVRAPGPKHGGLGSGLVGDFVGDRRNHGGDDQAVYAYAREDLDAWSLDLGRPFSDGAFGENLTTVDLDVTGALIGERWRIGIDVVLEVSVPRIPCATFAGWLAERGWIKTFTRRAVPGAYLRVISPGLIRSGDAVVVERPDHDVSIGLVFRALTLEPELLPRLLAADALPDEAKERARRRLPFDLD